MANQPNPQEVLQNFARSLEQAIGTDDAITVLQRLTKFFQESPGTLQEIQDEAHKDPQLFDSLLTEKSVNEFKELIVSVKSGNLLGGFLNI